MKKTLLIACFSLLSISVFAQFPDAGSKGITFGISGTSGLNLNVSHNGSLMYKYYINDGFIMRYSALISYSSTSNTSTSSGRESENDNTNYAFGLGIGCEKIFVKVDKFQMYGGLDLVPGISGGSSLGSNTVVDHTKAGGIDGDFNKTVTKRPQIFSIGLYPFLGFEYFITKNFSVGAEFSISPTFSFPGNGTTVTTGQSNGIPQPEVDANQGQKAQFSIASSGTALISGSFYFK
jgi:hypothetical protein